MKDWRKNRCVGPVLDASSSCNSLTDQNVAESIAGINCAKLGNFTPVSTQQIIDCSTGCSESSFEQGSNS